MSDTQDEQVSDPTEATEPTEGTGTEGTEGEGEAATPKPTTDELVAVLRTEVDSALANADGDKLAEGQAEALQSAYRAVPAAKRGQVQAEILRDKISEPGANHAAIATILEVMTQAPTTKTRAPKAAKPEVPEQELVAQALQTLDLAREQLLASATSDEVRTEAINLVASRNGDLGENAEAITASAEKAVKAVTVKARKTTGTGGPRVVKTESLSDLIADGRLSAGTQLTHGDSVATVTAEGKLEVNGQVSENPTAAAKAAGVTSSVNGWDYWQVTSGDKKVAVGTLRTK